MSLKSPDNNSSSPNTVPEHNSLQLFAQIPHHHMTHKTCSDSNIPSIPPPTT